MKWYVDFSSWCEVEADSREEAEQKFWDLMGDSPKFCESIEIVGIEEN
jgi:hypothetical protein